VVWMSVVAHPLLDAANVGLGDHAGAERVAQIVEHRERRATREDLDLAGRTHRMLLDSRQGIDPQRPDHLCPPEDAVQLNQQLALTASSMNRSHSAAMSANVTPARTMLAGVARRAFARTSRSQASAVRFVKYPVAGRPRSVQAGPTGQAGDPSKQNPPTTSHLSMPPVGLEPTTVGLKDAHMQVL
jgi:hypothetical protein